jgi:hypothetical protein
VSKTPLKVRKKLGCEKEENRGALKKTQIQNQVAKTSKHVASHRKRYVINEGNDPPSVS